MAKSKGRPVVCFSFADDPAPACVSRAAFLRDNRDDDYLVERVRRLRVGESFHGGGGASPLFTVTRTR